MNILHLTTHLNAGGITTYLYLLGQRLRAQGHNVFVVSSGGDVLPKFLAEGVQHQLMNIRTKSELDPRIYVAALQLREYIRKNKIDIIHAHTRVTQVMGQLLHQWTGCPYVSTCHGYFKTRFIRRIFPCWGQAVIAISRAVAKHLQEDFNVPEEKIFMIHNGIDIAQFPVIDEKRRVACRQEHGFNANEPVVGIIARLSDVKGHDVLIRAMAQVALDVPLVKLVLVGQGKEEERLRQLTQQLGLADRVMFLPTVGKPAEILPLFDIFVLPSYKEGLALSLVEAQSSGLAVVATRVGGIPEVVIEEDTGLLVEPGDARGLARAITRLLRDKEFARKIGIQACKFVSEEFNAQRMGQKTIQVYERLLSGT